MRVRPALLAVLLVVGVILLWWLRQIVLLLFAAGLVAVALERLASLLAGRLRLGRRPLVVLVWLGGLLLLAAGGWLFGSAIALQVAQLRTQLPQMHAALNNLLASFGLPRVDLEAVAGQLADSGMTIAGGASTAILGGASIIGGAFLVVFLGLFLALDPERYRDGFVALFPLARRRRVREVLGECDDVLARWLLCQVVCMAVVGGVSTAGFYLLGVPLAGLLGLLVGVLDFVPTIGSLAGAVVAVLVALIDGPWTALYVAIFMTAVQQAEGNILLPLVQAGGLDLPPALSLVGILALGALLGLPGAILAVPLLLILRVFVERFYIEDWLHDRRG